MMMDDAHYQDLDPARLDEILASYRPEEKKPTDGNTADP